MKEKFEKKSNWLKMNFCFYVDLIGRGGGIPMMWKEEIELDIINYSADHIHSMIRGGALKLSILLAGFYGRPKTTRRKESWDLLSRINQDLETSWYVLGDFNKITAQDEKLGGRPRPSRHMVEFRGALEKIGLLGLG